MQIITLNVGKPCPTTREIREWTGMPMKRIWPYVHGMADRGLIEIEVRESRDSGRDPKRRRLRIANGEWTDWTARMGPDGIVRPRKPKFDSEGNVINIDQKVLKNCIDEVEASRARQRAETELQREIFKKARTAQLDPKAMRIVLQRRAMGDEKRDEQDYYIHAYEMALGGKKAAMEALAAGASVREAAEVAGISLGATSALRQGVQKS